MTLLSGLVGTAVALTFVSDSYMYLCARRELRRTKEHPEKYFTGSHWSEFAWMRGYVGLARAHGLPVWPVYLHRIAWPALLILLPAYLYSG